MAKIEPFEKHTSEYEAWFENNRIIYESEQGLAAVFLYNRAIKIPLLPVMIYYFDVAFTVLLLVFTVIASVIEGKMIEILEC